MSSDPAIHFAEMALCSELEKAKASGTREDELVGLRKAIAIVSALNQPDTALCAEIARGACAYEARQVAALRSAEQYGRCACADHAGEGSLPNYTVFRARWSPPR